MRKTNRRRNVSSRGTRTASPGTAREGGKAQLPRRRAALWKGAKGQIPFLQGAADRRPGPSFPPALPGWHQKPRHITAPDSIICRKQKSSFHLFCRISTAVYHARPGPSSPGRRKEGAKKQGPGRNQSLAVAGEKHHWTVTRQEAVTGPSGQTALSMSRELTAMEIAISSPEAKA